MREFHIRASSIGELFDCPARWAAKYVEGKFMPSAMTSHVGTSLHKASQVYDQSVLDGKPVTVDEAKASFADAFRNPQREIKKTDPKETAKLEIYGLALIEKYIVEIAPRFQFAAIERKLDPLSIHVDGTIITLTGSLDRLIKHTADRFRVGDVKSGKNAVSAKGTIDADRHALQMATYNLLAKNTAWTDITPDGKLKMDSHANILALGVSGKLRAAVGEICATSSSLVGTATEPGRLEYAAKILKGGLFYGNDKSMMCHNDYCPAFATCRFRTGTMTVANAFGKVVPIVSDSGKKVAPAKPAEPAKQAEPVKPVALPIPENVVVLSIKSKAPKNPVVPLPAVARQAPPAKGTPMRIRISGM